MALLRVLSGSSAACFGKNEVGHVGFDVQNHVAGMVSYCDFWVGSEVIHKHGGFRLGVGSGCCLFGGEFVEGWENGGVNATSVVQIGARDGLDALGSFFVEARSRRVVCGLLRCMCAVVWFDPFVLCVFGRSMAEFCQCSLNIAWHGDVHIFFWLFH
jgi:hypothetical protein